MILKNALREYTENFRVAISFGLLLLFVPVLLLEFFQSQNIFFSSGTFFAEYALVSPIVLVPEIVLVVFFFVLYALFVSLMVFGVRKNLSKVRVEYYLREMVKKFSTKIFIFFLASGLLMFTLSLILISVLDPATSALIASLVLLIISLALLFVPQAIVVDEVGVLDAVRESFDFIKKYPGSFFRVVMTGTVLVALVLLIEFALDFLVLDFLPGRFVSAFLLLVFVVPFLEAMKTYVYMLKFDLVRKSEQANNAR